MTFLDPSQHATLLMLADALVPEAHGMPSAAHVLADGRLTARVLKLRCDLAAVLPSILDRLRGIAPTDALPALEYDEPAAFEVLFQVVASGYYLDAEVKQRLGYDGQQAHGLSRAGFGGEDLVERMMSRPKRYRCV